MARSKYPPKSAVEHRSKQPSPKGGRRVPVIPAVALLALGYAGWKYTHLNPADQSWKAQKELIVGRLERMLGREKPREERIRPPVGFYGDLQPSKDGFLDISFDVEGDGVPEQLRWNTSEKPVKDRFLGVPTKDAKSIIGSGWSLVYQIPYATGGNDVAFLRRLAPNYDPQFLAVFVHSLKDGFSYQARRVFRAHEDSGKWNASWWQDTPSFPEWCNRVLPDPGVLNDLLTRELGPKILNPPKTPRLDFEQVRKEYEERERKNYDLRLPAPHQGEPLVIQLDVNKDGKNEVIHIYPDGLFQEKDKWSVDSDNFSLIFESDLIASNGEKCLSPEEDLPWIFVHPHGSGSYTDPFYVITQNTPSECTFSLGIREDPEVLPFRSGTRMFYQIKISDDNRWGKGFPGYEYRDGRNAWGYDYPIAEVTVHPPTPGNLIAPVTIDSKVEPVKIVPPAPGTFVPTERKEEAKPKVEPKAGRDRSVPPVMAEFLEAYGEAEKLKSPASGLLPEPPAPLNPPPLLAAKDPCYQTHISLGSEKKADFSVADGEAETFTLKQTKKGITLDSLVAGQNEIAHVGRGSKTKPAFFVYENQREGGSSYTLVAVRRKRGKSYDVESCFAVPEPLEGIVSAKVLGSTVTYNPKDGEVVVQTKKGKFMTAKVAREVEKGPALDLDHRLAHELFAPHPHDFDYETVSRPLVEYNAYIRDYDGVARAELGKKEYKGMQRRVKKWGDDYRTLTQEFFPTELINPKTFTARDMVEGFAVLSALQAKAATGDADARYYTYAHLSRHLLHIAQSAKEAGNVDTARSAGQEALNITRSMLAEYGEQVRPLVIYTRTMVANLAIPNLGL